MSKTGICAILCVFSSAVAFTSCGKDTPTAPVTAKVVQLPSPASGALTVSNSDNSATNYREISFSPESIKYPLHRIELLPDPGDGTGIIYDCTGSSCHVTITPGAEQATVLSTPAGNIAPGTYTGVRVSFCGPNDSDPITYIKAAFTVGGASYVTASPRETALTVDPTDQPIARSGGCRSEIRLAEPLVITKDQPAELVIYWDATHQARVGFGGQYGSHRYGADCTGTWDSDLGMVTSGVYVCAPNPLLFASTESVTPTAERYLMNVIQHACDDPVDDGPEGYSALYNLYFHPSTEKYMGGTATKYIVEGVYGGGEPISSGMGIFDLSETGTGIYKLRCNDFSFEGTNHACTFESFQRATHTATYLNSKSECWGYTATKL